MEEYVFSQEPIEVPNVETNFRRFVTQMVELVQKIVSPLNKNNNAQDSIDWNHRSAWQRAKKCSLQGVGSLSC